MNEEKPLTAYVEGFSVSGEEIVNLKDKSFEIVALPKYEERPDMDDPKKMKNKMILTIKLISTDCTMDYYPNKTSQKVIIARCGRSLADWVGFKGVFEVKEQKVAGEDKLVIYIKKP